MRWLDATFLNRLAGWLLCIAVAAHTAGAHGGAASRQPANIVLIMADDFGYECVAANGGRSYQTPHLDQLASDGVRFEHCYSQPLCTPSRVQLMTGLYNVRNYAQFGWLEESQVTFAQLLRDAGYATAIVGKWQLGAQPDRPRHFGFDHHCLWHFLSRQSRYAAPGLVTDGVERVHDGQYGPDLVTDYACRFIDQHRDRPFLLYYPMMLTHAPFEPTPHSRQWDADSQGSPNERGRPEFFAEMVAYADHCVGRILNQLEASGVAENTLVMFTGDNGSPGQTRSILDGRSMSGGKGQTTDAGTRVPLLVRWPGRVPGGLQSEALVDFTDFFPTILDAAAVDCPAALALDGVSLIPTLTGADGPHRQWVYVWYARNGGPTGIEFARDQRYKLYADGRFFDVQRDVREQSPLGLDTLQAEARASHQRLRGALDQFTAARPEKFANWRALSRRQLQGDE